MPASARPSRRQRPDFNPEAPLPVTLADIQRAHALIADQIDDTPCRRSRTLSAIAGCEVWLKFENFQFTASFKERGALNKLLSLTEAQRKHGVIAVSAGNHAQGVAYHAQRLGIPATIVMPLGTPFTKVQHTQNFGATVIIEGNVLSDAFAFAERLRTERNLTFIHPFDDPRIIAGQGTIALEMLEAVPNIDAMILPIGGGGLISGMAIGARAVKPDIEIFGVQTARYPSMHRAIYNQSGVCGGATVAEGIAVQTAADTTRNIIDQLVDDILLVDEPEIEHAIALLLEVEKVVVEGAGAVGLAALLKHRDLFAGRKVGLVLTAGNIDTRMLGSIILRELSRSGRISVFHIELTDRPGSLALIAKVIGDAGGNIIEVLHNRLSTDVSVKDVAIDITVETRDAQHRDMVASEIAVAGFPYKIIVE
jgi:threonine dehydratase